jgi:hypothetical protein
LFLRTRESPVEGARKPAELHSLDIPPSLRDSNLSLRWPPRFNHAGDFVSGQMLGHSCPRRPAILAGKMRAGSHRSRLSRLSMEEHHASTNVGRGGRRNRCNHTLGAGGPIGSPGREYGQDPLGGLKRCVSAPGAANMPEVLHGRLHSAWAWGRVQVLRENGVCTSAALSGSSEDRRKNANASFHSHGRHELSHWLLDGDFARQRGTGECLRKA